MSAPERTRHQPPRGRQTGAYAVEFALVVIVFFLMVFGVIELARVLYIWNTLPEVTRRAAQSAASTNFKDDAALDLIRQASIFRTDAGELAFASPITDAHVRIDYMALTQSGSGLSLSEIPSGSLPASPAQNRINCTIDPNAANCISFVRVRICDPSDTSTCTPVNYVPLMPLIPLALQIPPATSILTVGTFGYRPGMAP